MCCESTLALCLNPDTPQTKVAPNIVAAVSRNYLRTHANKDGSATCSAASKCW